MKLSEYYSLGAPLNCAQCVNERPLDWRDTRTVIWRRAHACVNNRYMYKGKTGCGTNEARYELNGRTLQHSCKVMWNNIGCPIWKNIREIKARGD